MGRRDCERRGPCEWEEHARSWRRVVGWWRRLECRRQLKKPITAPFEIPVPPGTVVKRKGTGALLGELINPGGCQDSQCL